MLIYIYIYIHGIDELPADVELGADGEEAAALLRLLLLLLLREP